MTAAARVLKEMTSAGLRLAVKDKRLVVRGPAAVVARYGKDIKKHGPALVAMLSSHKVKCRDCLHATPAATCSRGRPWPGAQLLHPCPDFEPRPEGDVWIFAPPVRCEACAHFEPHATRPREMPGTCRLDESLQWPWQRTHRCARFEKGKC